MEEAMNDIVTHHPCDTILYPRSSRSLMSGEPQVSVPKQIDTLKEWGTRMGWRCSDTAIFPDYETGANPMRQGIQKVIKCIEQGWVKRVVIYSLSRLARDKLFVKRFIRKLSKFKVELWIYNLGRKMVIQNVADYMLLEVMALKDEECLYQLSEDVHWGKIRKFMRGNYLGWNPPPGYQWSDDKDLVIVPELESVVQRIFQEALAKSASEIAKGLEAERKQGKISPPKFGKKWNERIITNMLHNPLYCGKLVANRHRAIMRKTVRVPEDQWLHARSQHRPLVSVRLFEEVRMKLKERSPKIVRKHFITNILKDLLFCGHHARSMTMRTIWYKDKLSVDFRCGVPYCPNGWIKEEILIDGVVEKIQEIILKSSQLKDLHDQADHDLSGQQREITMRLSMIQNQLVKKEAERSECWKKCEKGFFSLESGGKVYREMEERIEVLKGQKRTLELERQNLLNERRLITGNPEFFKDFLSRFKNADRDDQALLLREGIFKIYLYERRRFEVYVKFVDLQERDSQ